MQVGVFTLGDVSVTTPLTGTAIGNGTGAVVNMQGITALDFQARLVAIGTNGTTAQVWLQTSLDQATTWFDIACLAFAGTSSQKFVKISGLEGGTTPPAVTDGALADNTTILGFLGDRFRMKITTTGTYGAASTISGRIVTR